MVLDGKTSICSNRHDHKLVKFVINPHAYIFHKINFIGIMKFYEKVDFRYVASTISVSNFMEIEK